MPELPDLQVFARNLQKKLKGKSVKKISVADAARMKITAAKLNKNIAGSNLEKVYREGKQLRFLFDNGSVLGMHLMLHGKLALFEKKNREKYSVAAILFDDGTGLALTDFQKKASVSLNPEESDAPDAMSAKMNAKFLEKIFSGSRKKVKDILLDQHIIRGIGNAYADEILWHARISPFSRADKIPPAKIQGLAAAIKKTLKGAEKQILKISPGIIAGELRDFMLIHHSGKTKSPGGKPIFHTSAKSRKTYYTEEQQLYK